VLFFFFLVFVFCDPAPVAVDLQIYFLRSLPPPFDLTEPNFWPPPSFLAWVSLLSPFLVFLNFSFTPFFFFYLSSVSSSFGLGRVSSFTLLFTIPPPLRMGNRCPLPLAFPCSGVSFH